MSLGLDLLFGRIDRVKDDLATAEVLAQHYADGLIEIAVSMGPRAYFPAMGSGQRDVQAYDPVADLQAIYPKSLSRANAYCTAALKLGIL